MNNTIKSFATVGGFSVMTRLVSFGFKMWMSRELGAETVGLYQIALSIILLLFSLTAGAPTVLSRKVAGAMGDRRKQNGYLTGTLLLGLGVGVVLIVVFFCCHNHLDALFADDRCVTLFLIMLPTLLTSTLYGALRSWFWGQKKFLAFSSTELLEEVIKIVVAVILAGGVISTINGGMAVAIAFTVSDLVCVMVLLALFFAKGGRFAKPVDLKEICKATIPLSTMRILTSLSATFTALIIPERLVASGVSLGVATAEYGRIAGMAFPLIIAPATVVSALSVVLIPDVASLKQTGEVDRIKSKLKASMIFSALVAGLFFVMYLPFGDRLGELFFGDRHAGEFISYCSPMVFPIAIGGWATPMLNSLGLEKRTFINYVAGAVLMLPCIFLLPQLIGVYAVAVGMGVTMTVTALLNLVTLKKHLKGLDGLKKTMQTICFSAPLGAIGLFTIRVLERYVGHWFSAVVTGFYLIFFFVICVSAFEIVDVKGYVKLLAPTTSLSMKGKALTGRFYARSHKTSLKPVTARHRARTK